MSAFKFHEIRKSYTGHEGAPVHALRGLTLEGGRGVFMVLLGSSGSGKTTALRILAGLETPDSGDLSIEGRPARGIAARDRDAAMVFQHPALYPHLTVEANIRLGLEIRRVPADEIRRRTAAAAELMEVGGFLNRLPATLSGGQMQRVALARAMARRPALMLLDEPLASLDGPSRGALKERIRVMQAATGTTTVLVTHDQAEAFYLGHHIALLEDGRTLQTGTPRDLYFRPENLAVARFLSKPCLNTLAGKLVSSGTGVCFEAAGREGEAGVSLFLPPRLSEALSPWRERALILGVRPEDVVVAVEDRVDKSSFLSFSAPFERVEFLGGVEDLHLRLAGHPWVARGARFKAERGARVEVFVDTESLLFFDPATEKRAF